MLWFFLAILAYLFFAISAFIDRLLMKGSLKSPFAFAFYAGILNSIPILLFFLNPVFNFFQPISFSTLILGALTGFLTVWTMLPWAVLVLKEEISKATPIVGSLQPIFIVVISLLFFFKQAIPSLHEISAFFLFLLGSLIIIQEPGKQIFSKRPRFLFLLSSFYFALTLVMLKALLLLTNFWTAIFLLGMGSVIGTGTLLFLPETRSDLAQKGFPIQKNIFFPFLIGRAAGTVGSIFITVAILFATITQVPLISALTGVQFVFLYLLLFLFIKKFPEMEEKLSGRILFLKLGGVLMMILGFVVLALK